MFQVRLLSGNDGCDKWSDQTTWDDALLNMNIVVCTPQTLLDAMHNGFVRLESITLLVFDEAHNCIRKNAANKIMQDFYHPARKMGIEVPHILGLTASPIMNDREKSLR